MPTTVTSRTAQEIARSQARDLRTLLDSEPGVAVRQPPARMSAVFGATGRGGNEGINVRGLEGNQVLLQTDGVRLPLAYESGPFVAGRGDYIDVEAFKRVELVRGPSSASFGSDGLAGAVSFITKDPADLLTLGKPWQAGLKLGYASADDSWVAVPTFALRFDHFEIDPDTGNPLYTRNNSVPPTRLSDQAVSPRLGLIWQALPQLAPYAQLAQGFRAPTPWQINGGVTNLGANPPYRSVGNPDLKPERSNSFELGLRARQGSLRGSIALFKSRYEDFIIGNADVTRSTQVPLDPGMPANTRTFQSINAARAEISGVELMGGWDFAPGWTVEARYAHARGDQWAQDGTTTPLPTIEPDKGTLALRYDRPGAYGGELLITGQKSQRRPFADNLYIPAGYLVGDILAWWDITRQWQLNLALNNIGNAKYALWSDVRGLPANTSIADAYTQPGRNFALSLRHQF